VKSEKGRVKSEKGKGKSEKGREKRFQRFLLARERAQGV
jgi:hypothetical protein